MYELEETPDYAPEGAVEGMTVENENVLILQDRDFEIMDEERLGEYIEESFKDLGVLTRLNVAVKEALAEPSKATKWFLNHAQETRIQMARHYGGSVALESFYTPSTVVFALEEEEKKEVGIIGRIIDSIVRAFKWLWKKITGVFSSKDPKEKEKGLDDAIDASKKAEEAGVEATTIDKFSDQTSDDKEVVSKNLEMMKRRAAKHKKFNMLLGCIDPAMQATKLIPYFKKLTEESAKIEALVMASVNAYNLFEKTVSGINKGNLANGITVFTKTIPEMVMSPASHFTSISQAEAAPYFEGSFAAGIAKAYRLENLAFGKDLCIAEAGGEAEGVFRASYKALTKFDASDVSKINILSSTEQKAFSDAVTAFGTKLESLNKAMVKASEVANKPDGLKKLVDLFDTVDLGRDGNALRGTVKSVVGNLGAKLVSLTQTMAGVVNELGTLHTGGVDWIKECSSVLDESARIINRSKKEEPKKEGE
jgi:hypothetical protein